MYYGEMKEKDIRANYNYGTKTIACGYCSMQNLLHYRSRVGYTCGIYGWNFDVYNINGTIITTGYRRMIGKTVDYALLKEYETAAEKIINDRALDYEAKKRQVDALLQDFIIAAA